MTSKWCNIFFMGVLVCIHSKKVYFWVFFNPILGQIWTNPAVGLHFAPNFWVCPYL